MFVTTVILLVSQEETWLDKLIERDRKFATAVVEYQIVPKKGEETTVSYAQMDGNPLAVTAPHRGRNETWWFTYDLPIRIGEYGPDSDFFKGEAEDLPERAIYKHNEKLTKFVYLVIGSEGLTGWRRHGGNEQWRALTSLGLGVSLLDEPHAIVNGDTLVVTGTVASELDVEFIFKTGQNIVPQRMTQVNYYKKRTTLEYIDYETKEGVLVASSTITEGATMSLKSLSTEQLLDTAPPIDWCKKGTFTLSMYGCNARKFYCSDVVAKLGRKPKTIGEIVEYCVPSLANGKLSDGKSD